MLKRSSSHGKGRFTHNQHDRNHSMKSFRLTAKKKVPPNAPWNHKLIFAYNRAIFLDCRPVMIALATLFHPTTTNIQPARIPLLYYRQGNCNRLRRRPHRARVFARRRFIPRNFIYFSFQQLELWQPCFRAKRSPESERRLDETFHARRLLCWCWWSERETCNRRVHERQSERAQTWRNLPAILHPLALSHSLALFVLCFMFCYYRDAPLFMFCWRWRHMLRSFVRGFSAFRVRDFMASFSDHTVRKVTNHLPGEKERKSATFWWMQCVLWEVEDLFATRATKAPPNDAITFVARFHQHTVSWSRSHQYSAAV